MSPDSEIIWRINTDIKYGLSEYACTSLKEFIAEAFAEYMCNQKIRPIATRVAELLEKAYLVGS